MDSLISYLYNNGFDYLIDNLYGLYLPLIITFVLILFSGKELIKKDNLIMFGIGLIGCFILSYGKVVTNYHEVGNVIMPISYNQFHSVNVFGIIYLIKSSFPLGRKIEMNYSVIWIGSFISLWIVDGWYAFTETPHS